MKLKNVLPVSVLRDNLGDCTLGGITSNNNRLFLVIEGAETPFECEEHEALKVVKRHLFGEDYYHAEPIVKHKEGHIMMGGNFVYTSDSRFKFKYPLPVHDRIETQAEYNTFSK